ncbi:D-alanyl-D-alanine carboxypeptidase [Thermoactinomyces daqus]|uniref:serine-type D-Ala-D-Ala carboxypeptidase n=1 Tax=Thermoactinomyces daqus TaxID=1329516 RepID=A0A7W2AHL4_9BACL|nr:D-alanyl-D-alanine carboxypeptidase family protein [Thermoactinomyces daqus]MBA4541948.1 D-alanyl-D-alanine carboxypeptidase [Thermoactinomyces daqus]
MKNKINICCCLCLLVFMSWITNPAMAAAAGMKPDVQAKSYILIDFQSGEILDEKNAEVPYPPASMTKMMTVFVVLDQIKSGKIHWDDLVTISPRVAAINEAQINLTPGEKITVRELFIAALVESANDAAVALAEYVGGTEENFVAMMNQKAKELGMNHTHFNCASGLDFRLYPDPPKVSGPNVMSAHDTAILATKLIQTYPEILKTTSIPYYTFFIGTKKQLKVTNWDLMLPGLKYSYPGVDGLKTGHTNTAGYCFTGTAQRGDLRLISVVMGTRSDDHRFLETKKLFDYGFQEFVPQVLVKKGGQIPGTKELALPDGVERTVPVTVDKAVKLPVHKGESARYQVKVTFKPRLNAPLKQGEVVGTAQVLYNGKPVQGVEPTPVVTAKAVEKASWIRLFFREIGDTVKNWFN